MSRPSKQTTLSVALIGNPNTGKSTLFGELVGIHQHVGNYPGVTVEKKTGHLEHEGRRYELIDLPGLYSLAPRSRDEMVAVDLLLGRQEGADPIAAVVCIVDASNLRRQLYLFSQVLELGLPTVLALNMLDVARHHGVSIDVDKLQERLGVPVVSMQANRGIGIDELKNALGSVADGSRPDSVSPLPELFEKEVTKLQSQLASVSTPAGASLPRYLVGRLLLDVSGYLRGALFPCTNGEIDGALESARERLADAGCRVPTVETAARHVWARRTTDGVVKQPREYKVTVSDKIDRVLTHRFWGTLLFAVVMVVLFQSVFVGAEPFVAWIDSATGWLENWIGSIMPEGAMRSLLVDGVLAGVGGVLAFLPLILILFLFIAILEDCGYMARAAYLMDKFMSRIGLSGKSFIPMLSSCACAIPGIMAARVIENERDRLTTILVAPLMTCSARLPIYALLIGAFIPATRYLGGLISLQGITLAALYVLGIVSAVIVASVMKRTIFRGQTPPFLMELPGYKWPSLRHVFFRVAQRGFMFVRCAGTLILTVSVIVWAALYYPHNVEVVEAPYRAEIQLLEKRLDALEPDDPDSEAITVQIASVEHEISGAYQRQSVLGRLGRSIEPVFRPLGWDWRIGTAVMASLPAREIVVATLSVIYNLGDDVDAESTEGRQQLIGRLNAATWDGTDRPVFNLPVALSIMVFFALCAQCVATLVVIRRETNSWRWPAFTFAYMTTLAYVGAMITYQVGMLIVGSGG